MKINDISEGIFDMFDKDKRYQAGLDKYAANKNAMIARQVEQQFLRSFKTVYDSAVDAGHIVTDDSTSTSEVPDGQTPSATAGNETPEQKRIRLQKAAQRNIDKIATPVPQPNSIKTVPKGKILPKGSSRRLSRLSEHKKYNYQVESLISGKKQFISEAVTPGQYAKAYLDKLTQGFDLTNYQDDFDAIAREFDQEAKSTKQFPVKAALKLYKMYVAARSTQKKDKFGRINPGITSSKPSSQTNDQTNVTDTSQTNLLPNLKNNIGVILTNPTGSKAQVEAAMTQLGVLLTMGENTDDLAEFLGAGKLYDAVIAGAGKK